MLSLYCKIDSPPNYKCLMEPKKNEKYDLEKKTPLFFAIGLVVALLCITLAFEWRGEFDRVDLSANEAEFEETYLVPPTIISPPKPPKPVEKLAIKKPIEAYKVVATNEVKKVIETLAEPSNDDPFIPPIEALEVEFADNTIHDYVESMPEFPGGMDAFYEYIGKKINYPSQARRMGISGKVFVQFIIDTDGSLIEIKTIKGIGLGCNEEAERVLKNSPKWTPGKQRGREVKVRMVLPIVFSLN